jgi:hypothetical protein
MAEVWVAEETAGEVAKRVGETIYGTLILMSVLTYVSERTTDPRKVGGFVAGTVIVLFLTRWYAEVLADTLAYGKVPGRKAGRRIFVEATPLLAVAVVPLFLLELAVLKIVHTELAVSVSLLIGAASLAIWGFVRARRTSASIIGTIFISTSTMSLGFLLVLLKAIVH